MALLETRLDTVDLARLVCRDRPVGALVHVEHSPPRTGIHADPQAPVDEALRQALGVDRMWQHQARAIDLVRSGRSVVVATGTASGKSLCYQVPIAEAVRARRPGTALLLCPTKALAHDQLRTLARLEPLGVVAACYDGDAGSQERAWVRRNANVVLTNPEMLHHGILPNHARWASFLGRLSHVVVDELHLLRGVFGAHVGHLVRRLRRLAHHYGADPTFVMASATIGAPARLARSVCGREVEAITEDAAPRAERWFALWNPPPGPDGRRPSHTETADMVATLVGQGLRTLAFCRSRRLTEVIAAETRRRLSDSPEGEAEGVRAYRGGYLPEERREIERQLVEGECRAVVATSALELGVDIGGLDACVLDGFPGTIASLRQQAGRAGRQGGRALAVLVAGEDQLDQYLMAHPDEVFTRQPEPAVVNLANEAVLVPHLACASYELALTHADEKWWPGILDEGVRRLVHAGGLRIRRRPTGPMAVWDGRGVPTHRVTLRRGGGGQVRILDPHDQLVGTVDRGRATAVVHPGAVYLHQGDAWLVTGLDLTTGMASVIPHHGDEFTSPRTEVDLRVLCIDTERSVGAARLHLGEVEVTTRVTGYRRRHATTGESLGTVELDLPPGHLVTRSFWYTVHPEVLARSGLTEDAWPGTLHAVEHAAIGLLPLFAICDRWDVGGVSTARQADTAQPSVFVFDAYEGGAGIAELGWEAGRSHLKATLELIAGCTCQNGCPSCVQSPKCGNGNEPLDKTGAAGAAGRSTGLIASAGARSTAPCW